MDIIAKIVDYKGQSWGFFKLINNGELMWEWMAHTNRVDIKSILTLTIKKGEEKERYTGGNSFYFKEEDLAPQAKDLAPQVTE